MYTTRALDAARDGDLDAAILAVLDGYQHTWDPRLCELLDELSLQRLERVGGWGESGKAL